MTDIRANVFKSTVLLLWAVLFTALTFVLGAAPLNALRKIAGRVRYFTLVLILGGGFLWAGWIVLALAFIFMAFLIAVFNEFEQIGCSVFTAGFAAVILTAGLGLMSIGGWAQHHGPGWYAKLLTQSQTYIDSVAQLGFDSGTSFKADDLLVQTPSALVILCMVGLLLALLLERPLLGWLREGKAAIARKLNEFAAPDFFIWLLMMSLLGSFVQHEIRWVEVTAVNLLNVCILLYFFQGLAVVGKYFELFQIGTLWRIFWYTLLVIQLFLLVTLIGVADYWFNFRERFIKKAAEMKKSTQ